MVVTEPSIILYGHEVRAVLDGRQSQVRRVIKPQPESPRGIYDVWPEDTVVKPFSDGTHWGFRWSKQQHGTIACDFRDSSGLKWKCPYGKPGDRLWVRETFMVVQANSDMKPTYAGSKMLPSEGDEDESLEVLYRADCARRERFIVEVGSELSWQPSIHMPRGASRITLEVTDVRVERLQEISEADARAEGCGPDFIATAEWAKRHGHGDAPVEAGHRQRFLGTFYSYNKRTRYGENPWVWAITFKVLGAQQ